LLCLAGACAAGCRPKPPAAPPALPLPPGSDSGLYDGQYVQTDYGFGFPVPPKWSWLQLTAEEEVDEVARFRDPSGKLTVKLSVQDATPGSSLTLKGWQKTAEQDLVNHLFKVEKEGTPVKWKTAGPETWLEAPFDLSDGRGQLWADREWVLQKDDLLISVQAVLSQKAADTPAGKKLFEELQGALTQIHWYEPLGPRGISLDYYELQVFTSDFCRALETGSPAKVDPFFSDVYPARPQWEQWYGQWTAGADPEKGELKAELSGLVIKDQTATAVFTLTRMGKEKGENRKSEKAFALSKAEGSWKIEAPWERR
jgi:hypothetical protein